MIEGAGRSLGSRQGHLHGCSESKPQTFDLGPESLYFCSDTVPAVDQPGDTLSSATIPGPATRVLGRDKLLGTFLPFF